MYISDYFTPNKLSFGQAKKLPIKKHQELNTKNSLLYGTLLALATLAPITVKSSTITNDTLPAKTIVLKKLSPVERTANEMNLSATPNQKVYYDKNKNTYYMWDNKEEKFNKAKHITNVYETGYIKTKKGEYLDPNGNPFLVKDLGKYLISKRGGFRTVGRDLAIVHGYEQSDIAKDLLKFGIGNNQQLELYYDKENNQYLRWNYDTKNFEKSPVTEVKGEYYSEGKKRFKIDYSGTRSTIKNVSEQEYQANKAGLYKIKNRNNVYTNQLYWWKPNTYYYWNADSAKLIPFGHDVDIKTMLSEKADGKIGNFRQGDIGDCWLLAPINGMLHHPDPILRARFTKELEKSLSVDKDNNITVHLRGINKKYTITPQEIDSVLTKSNHYSIGDRDVVAIEMGLEKYFRTLVNTKPSYRAYTNTFNMNVPPREVDFNYVLDGGNSHNAIHLITGKESHCIFPTHFDNIIRIDNIYQKGNISEDFLLDKLQHNIVLVSYKEEGAQDSHIVSLYGIDDKNVYVIDSNRDELDPDKTVRPTAIPKEKIFKELNGVTFTDLSTNLTPQKTKPIKAKPDATKDVRPLIPDYYFK